MIDTTKYEKVVFYTSAQGTENKRRGWKICYIKAGESILGTLPREILEEMREKKIYKKRGILETSLVDRVAVLENIKTRTGRQQLFFPRPRSVRPGIWKEKK